MIKQTNLVADTIPQDFVDNLNKSIEGMQKINLAVEVQYVTVIQHDGKALFTAFVIGRENYVPAH